MRGEGHEKLHTWFGLSYASFLVLPRSFMNEMPDEWQSKMADLLSEYDQTFKPVDEIDSVIVSARKDNKFTQIPDWILNYRRPNRERINSVKYSINQDGSSDKI